MGLTQVVLIKNNMIICSFVAKVNIFIMTKQFYKTTTENSIKLCIRSRVGAVAFAENADIIGALAYACTFKSPRRFSDMEMNEQSWQDLATTITVLELNKVRESLSRFSAGNRLFYILGCLTRVYSRRKSTSQAPQFRECHYTKSELSRAVTRPEELANIEW